MVSENSTLRVMVLPVRLVWTSTALYQALVDVGMFLESNICWVSSGTVMAWYCWLPQAVWGETSHEGVRAIGRN